MAAKWSLHAVPRLVRMDEIVIPKVVGLISPPILLPASALSGLSPGPARNDSDSSVGPRAAT